MPRRKAELLTQSEFEIMEVMWNMGQPVTRFEIEDNSPTQGRSVSGIYAILQRLEDRGAIKKAGSILRGSKRTTMYSPAISYEEYLRYVLKHIYSPGSDNGREKLVHTLIAIVQE